MKNYIISQVKEFGTYFRNDTLTIKIRINDVITNKLTDPSDVSISIYDPCESIVTDESMESESSGFYTYDYSIPSDAQYGKYTVKIETTNLNSSTEFTFIVFPWNVCSRIREILSAYQQNDFTDYKLAILAWDSYMITLHEIYELHSKEKPLSDPDTGKLFDGINKRFQTRNYPIADINGDMIVTGDGELTCGYDISFYYIDENGSKVDGEVSVIDSDIGLIELTVSGNAVPNTLRRGYTTYHSESSYYNKEIMKEAVAYLTAYNVAMTYKSLDKVTLADVQTNRQLDAEKFKNKYEELIGMIGFYAIGSGK